MMSVDSSEPSGELGAPCRRDGAFRLEERPFRRIMSSLVAKSHYAEPLPEIVTSEVKADAPSVANFTVSFIHLFC